MDTTKLEDGDLFGPFRRFKLHHHKSDRSGIPSCWMVLDAETPDDLTGKPSVIRQAETISQAVAGLPMGRDE